MQILTSEFVGCECE